MHIHLSETTARGGRVHRALRQVPRRVVRGAGDAGQPHRRGALRRREDEDIAILKRHGVNVIHNPTSNLKLGSRLRAGAEADGMRASTSPRPRDARRANNNRGQCLRNRTWPDIMPWVTARPDGGQLREVLDMATVQRCKIQGRSDTGVLAVGKKAVYYCARSATSPTFIRTSDTPAL